jgi:hypothetical protein
MYNANYLSEGEAVIFDPASIWHLQGLNKAV